MEYHLANAFLQLTCFLTFLKLHVWQTYKNRMNSQCIVSSQKTEDLLFLYKRKLVLMFALHISFTKTHLSKGLKHSYFDFFLAIQKKILIQMKPTHV